MPQLQFQFLSSMPPTLALLLLLGLAAPAAQQRAFTGHPPEPPPPPPGGAPCPPCHCGDGFLDCRLAAASLLRGIGAWNVTGYAEVILDGEVEPAHLSELPALPAMPGLRRLSVRNRGLASVASGAFLRLPELTTLDLSHNQLTADAVRADVLRGPWRVDSYEPMSIEALDLSHNALHSLPRRALEHLRALRSLRLDGNPLRVLDFNTQSALAGAARLQTLSLSGCGLARLPADEAFGPAALQVLDLSRNALAAVPRALPASLRRLVLDGNPIRALPTDGSLAPPFAHLDGLEELSLSYMPALEDVRAGAFFGMPRLRALSLSHNPYLRQVHPAAFGHLGPSWTLTEVSLRNNSLRWLHPGLLAWRGLTFLDVADNPWHCSCNFTRWADGTLGDVNVNARHQVRCSSPEELSGQPLWNASALSCSMAAAGGGGRTGALGPLASPLDVALLVLAVLSLAGTALLMARRCAVRAARPRLLGRAARAPWRSDPRLADDKAPLYVPAPTEEPLAVPATALLVTPVIAAAVDVVQRRGDL